MFKFVSDQAVGHSARDKIHIFLTKTDNFRATADNAFLFISSGDYGGCFPIARAGYEAFLERDSFISCGNLVFYSDQYLQFANAPCVGHISDAHLKALHGHLVDGESMPFWQIQVACTALTPVL